MSVTVIPRMSLDAALVQALGARIAAPENVYDRGPCSSWNTASYFPRLYAAVEVQSNTPIGVLYAGGLADRIDAGWWLDSRFRGKGLGSQAIDAFAAYLKQHGVMGV